MDDQKFSQIGDLPSCLMIDIFLRLPTKSLISSRLVCRSWSLLFSDPVFVRLHHARSPTLILTPRKKRAGVKTNMICYKSAGETAGEDFEFQVNVTLPDSVFRCANSCHGLLCLENRNSVYVCNPILGEYITVAIPDRKRMAGVKSVLGFCSRSNQFKLLQIHSQTHSRRKNPAPKAAIYRIGNGTGQWNRIGAAPSCTLDFPDDPVNSFLNGSLHWADLQSQQIFYFDFESERFGSLPPPPAMDWSDLDHVRVFVIDGCLCICGFQDLEPAKKWVMKEYGVKKSWTANFSDRELLKLLELFYLSDLIMVPTWIDRRETTTYSPSLISLQDAAKSEQLTVLSITRQSGCRRTKD